jgi:hypothetical protein
LANWISVLAILLLVSANTDIGYIGIVQISVKIQGYWSKYQHIYCQNTSYRPNIGQNENIGIGIGANMLVLDQYRSNPNVTAN